MINVNHRREQNINDLKLRYGLQFQTVRLTYLTNNSILLSYLEIMKNFISELLLIFANNGIKEQCVAKETEFENDSLRLSFTEPDIILCFY